MADSYLAIATIATDEFMIQRVRACATQQAHLGNAPKIDDAQRWTNDNAYLWAASPSWGEKWESALAGGVESPGQDEAVITDGDILATVQALGT